jgi:phosphoribosylformimino-5-aminoimidazole carboxamide ribotide isomerase
VQVIPVLDVRGGRAVWANGGDRSRYRPLESVLAKGCEPGDLVHAFRDELGVQELYLADLDSIALGGKELRPAAELVEGLAQEGCGVWVDAGVGERVGVETLLRAGALQIVIGLETLPGLEVLPSLAREFGPERLALSLDLRGGRALSPVPALAALTAERLAGKAAEAGLTTLIALDLDRVGSRRGPALGRLARLVGAAPAACWVAGGGARDAGDLEALARAGYVACLVGTALHRGVIGREDVWRLAALAPPPGAIAGP